MSAPTVHRLFVEQAKRRPDAIAVCFDDETLSYGELDRLSTQMAHRLRRLGVGQESLVGICLPRSFDTIVAMLATLKAGGAYLPLDPRYPRGRLVGTLGDAGAKVLISNTNIVSQLGPVTPSLVLVDKDEGNADANSTTPLVDHTRPEHLAYVIYTSGSTGKPKGTLIPHSNLSRLFSATDSWFHFAESDVWTLFHSFAFDFSVWEIWGALCYGGRLVIVPYVTSRDPEQFHALLRKQRVTILNQTPSAFYQLMNVDTEAAADPLALRYVIFGGEALDPARLRVWFDKHGDAAPQLVNMYGITETTVHVTCRPLTKSDARSLIGVPIPDLEVYALDEAYERVAVGKEGELYVGGAGLARGYLGRPDLTAQRFVPDPFSSTPGGRLYRTGDRARFLPDGDIEYLGRIDHQVKIRGFRIELGEIEAVLLEGGLVSSAVVQVRTDSGAPNLVAYVVPVTRGVIVDVMALRAASRARLPEHMVPAAFIVLESLPLTANGKLDHKGLPAPIVTRPIHLGQPVAPRDDLELRIAQLWESLFNFAPIGVTDDFFELGGSSLRAAQMLGQLERETGKQVSIAELFATPDIEHVADVLRSSRVVGFRELVPIQQGTSRPLFLVHPVGGNVLCYIELARKLGPEQTVFAFQSAGLDGRATPTLDLVEMATHYLDAAREVQPHGPYRLGGYSSGGVIAFEMAKQLRKQGEEVELLLMLDSRAPSVHLQAGGIKRTRNFDDAVMSYWMLIILGRTLGLELPVELASLEQRAPDERLDFVLSHLQKHGLMAPGVGRAEMRAALDVYKANLRALMLYEPTRYDGPIVLFKVRERLPDRENTPNPPPWDWEQFIDGQIEEHIVPGNHFEMLGPKIVDHVARGVRDVISNLERRLA